MTKIEVIVKEAQTKEGKKFNYYRAVSKGGKLIDLRFKKVVENLPKKSGFIIVPEQEWNIDKTSKYPIVWVGKIESFEDYPTKEKEELF